MRALLSNRNLRFYVVGQTLSGVGSSALWLAVAIWVNAVTGSAAQAGLAMFAFGLSVIAGPLVGLFVDRVKRLPLLIWSNLAGIALIAPLLVVDAKSALWAVLAIMFGYGVINRIVNSAQSALLTTIVPDDLLAGANGILRSLQESMRIIVPLLGAGLYTWLGIEAVVILDMATFLVAPLLFLLMKVNEPKPVPPEKGEKVTTAALAGFKYLFAHRILLAVMGGATIAALVFGFTEAGMFAVATEGLGQPSAFVGVMGMVQGAGSIVIGFLIGMFAKRLGEVWMVTIGLAGFGAAIFATITPLIPVVLAASFMAGLTLPMASVGAVTVLQRYTPSNLQGRVYSAADIAYTGALTASTGLGSLLIQLVHYKAMYAVALGVSVLGALIALLGRNAPIPPGSLADHESHPEEEKEPAKGTETMEAAPEPA